MYTDFYGEYGNDLILMEKAAEWEMYKEAQRRIRAKLAPGSKQSPFPKGSLNQRFRAAGNRVPAPVARMSREGVNVARKINRLAGGNLYVRTGKNPEFGFRGRAPMTPKRAMALMQKLNISPSDFKNNPMAVMQRLQGTPLANLKPKQVLDLVFPKLPKAPKSSPKSAPKLVAPRGVSGGGGGGGSASKSLMKNPYVLGTLAAGGLTAAYLGTRKKKRR